MPANDKEKSSNQPTVDEEIKAVVGEIESTFNAIREAHDKLMNSKVEKLPGWDNYKEDADFHYKMAMGKGKPITDERTKLFHINQLYGNSKEPLSEDEQQNVAAAKNEIRKNLSDRLYDLREQQGKLNTILKKISPYEKLAQEQSAPPQVVSPQQLQSTDKTTPQLGAKASQTQSEKQDRKAEEDPRSQKAQEVQKAQSRSRFNFNLPSLPQLFRGGKKSGPQSSNPNEPGAHSNADSKPPTRNRR